MPRLTGLLPSRPPELSGLSLSDTFSSLISPLPSPGLLSEPCRSERRRPQLLATSKLTLGSVSCSLNAETSPIIKQGLPLTYIVAGTTPSIVTLSSTDMEA